MKKFLILLLLLGCKEPDFHMTVSEASEIQFVPTGTNSFNLDQQGYTENYCFHQKFLCTGLRRLQGYDAIPSDYQLNILKDDVVVQTLPFTKTEPLFLDTLIFGTESGSGTSWTIDTDPNVGIGVASSKILRWLITGSTSNTNYKFRYSINKSGGTTPIGDVYIIVYDASMTVLQSVNYHYTDNSSEDFAGDFNYVGNGSVPAYIGVSVVNTAGSTSIRVDEVSLLTVGNGVARYDIAFSPYDYGLCDSFLSFNIEKLFKSNPIVNPGFDTSLTPWKQYSNGNAWVQFGASSIQATNGPSKIIYQDVILENATYSLAYNNSRSISFGTATVIGILMDKAGTSLGTFTIPNGSGTLTFNGYVGGVQVRKLGFRATGGFVGTVTFSQFEPTTTGSNVIEYYTDTVEFVSEWANAIDSGKVDLQFKSNQNFADLLYDANSPYFTIQIDGRFRKERKVTAQKVLELTETVLNTATSVKKQRKFMITDVPDYMHTKICAALAHAASGSVLIDGYEISLENEYEEGTDRPETYNQSPAEVWLTIKNYYRHNVT